MAHEEWLDLRPREHQAAQLAQGDDVCERRLTEQDRRLPEEVTPGHPGALLAVDDDRGFALEDHEEARSRQPLPQDALPFRKRNVLEQVGDAGQLRARQVGKEREPRQGVDDFLAAGHPTSRNPALTVIVVPWASCQTLLADGSPRRAWSGS